MKRRKDGKNIRSSAAEYLTYVASVGDQQDSIEIRYENEKRKQQSGISGLFKPRALVRLLVILSIITSK